MFKSIKLFTLLFALLLPAYVFSRGGSNLLNADLIGGDSGGPKQSWEEIFENPKLKPHFPAVVIQGHLIDYNFLCVDTEYNVVRTKYQVKISLDEKTDSSTFDFLFEVPVEEHYVCSDNRKKCFYETIPLAQRIYVYKFVARNSGAKEVLFKKDYKLPNCK